MSEYAVEKRETAPKNCCGVTLSSHHDCWLLIAPYKSSSGGLSPAAGIKFQNLFVVTP